MAIVDFVGTGLAVVGFFGGVAALFVTVLLFNLGKPAWRKAGKVCVTFVVMLGLGSCQMFSSVSGKMKADHAAEEAKYKAEDEASATARAEEAVKPPAEQFQDCLKSGYNGQSEKQCLDLNGAEQYAAWLRAKGTDECGIKTQIGVLKGEQPPYC